MGRLRLRILWRGYRRCHRPDRSALSLNPRHARAWHESGLHRIFTGQPECALDDFQNYLGLSPRERVAPYMNSIGDAYFFCRQLWEADANLLAPLERASRFQLPIVSSRPDTRIWDDSKQRRGSSGGYAAGPGESP
jgi:hypothetical protein